MPFVYKITNPVNKVYIGSTKRPINFRWYRYKTLQCRTQPLLFNSFKKYGVENHNFEILCECSIEDMLKFEYTYGEEFDVLNPLKGLNCKLPKIGDIYKVVSDETKNKFKLNKNASGKRSKEFCDMRKEAMKGKKFPKKAIDNHWTRKVSQHDLNGNLIAEYNSVKEAALFNNFSYDCIGKAARGTRKTYKKFIWKHCEN